MSNLEMLHANEWQYGDGSDRVHFLTDRETAEVTAVAALGPLAVVTFERSPSFGLPQTEAPLAEVADDLIETFDPDAELASLNNELLNAGPDRHLAQAAIMFAAERPLAAEQYELAA